MYWLFSIHRSPQLSKLSFKDSRLDLLAHGIASNPHSFSARPTDNNDDTAQLFGHLDDVVEEERSGSEGGSGERLSSTTPTNNLAVPGPSSAHNSGEPSGVVDGASCKRDEKKASFLISEGETEEEEDDSPNGGFYVRTDMVYAALCETRFDFIPHF